MPTKYLYEKWFFCEFFPRFFLLHAL
jgi:hypothetical protein